jgi:hypothetical protein
MLGSALEVNPTLKTFFDIPGELRNEIYRYALFGYGNKSRWKIQVIGPHRYFVPYEPSHDSWEVELTISTLNMLGAMDKQMRAEIRSFFWARVEVEHVQDPHLCQQEGMLQFLQNIGPDTRAAIPRLGHGLTGIDSSPAAYTTFQNLLGPLSSCKHLASLRLDLMASNIFRGDKVHLMTYFQDKRRALHSPSLQRFADAITAMPRLKKLRLSMRVEKARNGFQRKASDVFLHFAFSGERLRMLWEEVRKRFKASDDREHGPLVKFNGRTAVRITLPDQDVDTTLGDVLEFDRWELGVVRLPGI